MKSCDIEGRKQNNCEAAAWRAHIPSGHLARRCRCDRRFRFQIDRQSDWQDPPVFFLHKKNRNGVKVTKLTSLHNEKKRGKTPPFTSVMFLLFRYCCMPSNDKLLEMQKRFKSTRCSTS